ncbi:SPFH domain-containing protein [Streptomyces sp. NPDC046275]|uniref:SPFH domain-containing protein n=1 Tax=Streptomyces sp. NPDC046275 TaxID=3157201 RepID=UPI003402DB52
MWVGVLVAGCAGLLALTLRRVSEAEAAVVERLGRFSRVLRPGLHVLPPLLDRIRDRVDLREQVVPFPPQPVITRDNLVVSIDTVVCFQVTDARAASYEVADHVQAIEQLTLTSLRNTVGGMDLERALASREQINAALRAALDEATVRWGIRVHRVELNAVEPPTSIQDAMEKQMRADRDKRAAVLTAEGIRQSRILQAEGEKQAALLHAEAELEIERRRRAAEAEDAASQARRAVPRQTPPPAERIRHPPLRPDDPRRLGRYR